MPNLRALAIILIVLTALVPPATGARAMPAFLAGRPEHALSFLVTRNGGPIGYHKYVFQPRKGGEFEVRVEADIRVSFLLIPFFVYEQQGVEVWENGRFKSMDYTTNDDGARHVVKAEARDGRLLVSVDGKPAASHPEMIPGSLWRRPPPQAGMMLDPGDGNPTPLKIQLVGEETIPVRGKPTRTTRLVWDDGLRREVWYDDENTLVQVWIKGDDGSDIHYVLQ